MREQWELNLRKSFGDPTLRLHSLMRGSVLAFCQFSIPLPTIANAVFLLAQSPSSSLPSIDGVAVNWHQAPSIFMAPKALLRFTQSLPQPPALPSSFSPLPAQNLIAPESPAAFTTAPISREDYIKMATEFDDQATLERMRSDPSYQPWKVAE